MNNTSLSTTVDSTTNERLHRTTESFESEEGDIEDNRIPSVESSKSNLSELSNVRINDEFLLIVIIYVWNANVVAIKQKKKKKKNILGRN